MKCYHLILILMILSIVVVRPVLGVPAAPLVHNLKQPDGTVFQVKLVGDEWCHWYETLDGYPVVHNASTGTWEYAIVKDGKLEPSGNVSNEDLPIERENSPRLKITDKYVGKKTVTVGTYRLPVILINFTDKPSTYSPSDFENVFFGDDNSVKKYYLEVSYGKLVLSGTVSGWYTADEPYDYYSSSLYRAAELVKEAVMKSDPYIDFSTFDNDGDGYVDVVVVIHSGSGAEESGNLTDIWSHHWSLSSAGVGAYYTDDGVIIDRYIIAPEISGHSISTIGVYCHEFGHALGLPDLYDIDGSSYGIGVWDLMAYGCWNGILRPGDSPAHLSAWCKWYLGWIIPIRIDTIKTASIKNVEEYGEVYQLLPNPGGPEDWSPFGGGVGEYFLVENRYKIGFDSALPGEGLLIWHIDESVTDNNNEFHKFIDLEEADGKEDLDKCVNLGDATDPWYDNPIGFTETSIPNSLFYNGTASGVRIYNIGPSGPVMVATLEIAGHSLSSVTSVIVENKTVYPGIFTINVKIMNVTDLAGFQFDIVYNSTLLEFVSAEKGDAIKSWSVFSVDKIAENKVRVVASYFGGSSFTGSGVIAKLKFNATTSGSSILDIENGKLSNSAAEPINASWVDGYVEVLTPSCMKGDLNNDKVIDVYDLVYMVNIIISKADETPCADINEDGVIDVLDLALIIDIVTKYY